MNQHLPEQFRSAQEVAEHVPLADDQRTAQRAATVIAIAFVVALLVTVLG
jgi:hypothetical protein